ncbi:MAG: glycosyltransferase family 4 protein [Gemmatimonadota bacterium]
MIRVATWPHWYAPNRYIDLFQSAIAPHGFEHLPGIDLDAGAMRAAGADVVHLHWAEWAWQSRGIRLLQRGGLRMLERFLDGAAAAGLPVIWTVHNLASHERSGATDRRGFALLHSRVRLRIFHSRSSLEEAHAMYPEAGEACVMYHGNYDGVFAATRSRAAVRRELGLGGQEERLLLMAGNLRRYKGHTTAVAALQSLSGAHHRYHLLAAGREGAGSRWKLRNRRTPGVTVIPRLMSDHEMADLHSAADAVLLPYEHVTGSGALMTALTLGRGVITSNHQYFSEMLALDQRAGVVARENSPAGLAAAIGDFFAVDQGVRGEAARGLADALRWPDLVGPIAERMRAVVATFSR